MAARTAECPHRAERRLQQHPILGRSGQDLHEQTGEPPVSPIELATTLTDMEIDRITAFLHALTGEQPQVVYPTLPPSVASTPRPQP